MLDVEDIRPLPTPTKDLTCLSAHGQPDPHPLQPRHPCVRSEIRCRPTCDTALSKLFTPYKYRDPPHETRAPPSPASPDRHRAPWPSSSHCPASFCPLSLWSPWPPRRTPRSLTPTRTSLLAASLRPSSHARTRRRSRTPAARRLLAVLCCRLSFGRRIRGLRTRGSSCRREAGRFTAFGRTTAMGACDVPAQRSIC